MKYLKKQPSEGEGWFNTTYNLWLEVQEQTYPTKQANYVGRACNIIHALGHPWDHIILSLFPGPQDMSFFAVPRHWGVPVTMPFYKFWDTRNGSFNNQL